MNKILVTGGSGFIGTCFINMQILDTDNIILNFDKLSYAGNANNHIDKKKIANYSFVRGDIFNSKSVNNVIKNFKPDVLINFAAETHVDRSIDNPDIFFNTNVLGTLNLLKYSYDFFKKNDHFRFIHVSTDEVFGSLDLNDNRFTEDNAYRPSSPYSASKASSDFLVKSWHKTYGLPAIVTNCSNNYGPYQFPEKLIPLIIANCLDEKPLPVYGNGNNIRDWLYVKDHCLALEAVIKNGKIGESYNIGGNTEMRNIDIVNKICDIMDEVKPRKNNKLFSKLIEFVDDRPGHDFRYAVNSSKIENELGWKPLESFETGIFKTIKWYIDNEPWWRNIQQNIYKQERLGLDKT